MTQPTSQLVLASTSPRRRLLLDRDGIEHRAISPGVDDGELVAPPGVSARHWVAALAYLKARAGHATLIQNPEQRPEQHDPNTPLLAADTVCVADGELIGQPTDAEHAVRMIHQMADATHEVLTGFALLLGPIRIIGVETAQVRVGPIPAADIQSYVDSGDWRGKAGGYNLEDRINAGWPINYDGDPTSIMGLPMQRLRGVLLKHTPWVMPGRESIPERQL